MLQGQDLIAKVRSMSKSAKNEVVRECGYFSVNNGKERLNYTSFYEALLEAKGIDLTADKSTGRKLSHQTKLQADGKLIVGSAYMKEMNLDPATTFNIEVGRRKVVLTAVPAE